jgi:hypothetical protein
MCRNTTSDSASAKATAGTGPAGSGRAPEPVGEQRADRRLGDGAEPERAHRDAELRAGEGDRQLGQGLQRPHGARGHRPRRLLDAGPAGREQRDLAATKNPLSDQQHDADESAVG